MEPDRRALNFILDNNFNELLKNFLQQETNQNSQNKYNFNLYEKFLEELKEFISTTNNLSKQKIQKHESYYQLIQYLLNEFRNLKNK